MRVARLSLVWWVGGSVVGPGAHISGIRVSSAAACGIIIGDFVRPGMLRR